MYGRKRKRRIRPAKTTRLTWRGSENGVLPLNNYTISELLEIYEFVSVILSNLAHEKGTMIAFSSFAYEISIAL